MAHRVECAHSLNDAALAGQERLKALLNTSKLFERHHVEGMMPDAVMAKVLAISGDLSQGNLGLSDSDRSRLLAEADIVIHCAACINFFEPIHLLLEHNYKV